MTTLLIDERVALLIADWYESAQQLEHASSRDALGHTARLVGAARAAGVLVLHCATVFRPGYPEIDDRNLLFAPKKAGAQPAVFDPEKLLHPALAPQAGEIVLGKHRVSAFHGTSLDLVLRANRISTLIVCGFATRGVVLSTVRQGADLDYRLIVAEDCCVERDLAVHDFLVQHILPMQARVAKADEVIAGLTTLPRH